MFKNPTSGVIKYFERLDNFTKKDVTYKMTYPTKNSKTHVHHCNSCDKSQFDKL
jgi:hypothetical protein